MFLKLQLLHTVIFHTLIWDKLLVFMGPNHYLNYHSFSFIFQLSSQHPYLETFVGKPLVYTVNIWNRTEVTRTLKKALKKQVKITLIFYHCYMGTAPYGGKGQNPFNAVTLKHHHFILTVRKLMHSLPYAKPPQSSQHLITARFLGPFWSPDHRVSIVSTFYCITLAESFHFLGNTVCSIRIHLRRNVREIKCLH